MRRGLTIGMVVVGLGLMVLSYFGLAAPWGASSVDNADPRLDFAGFFFIVGVLLTFSAAVVYELLPDRDESSSRRRR